MGFTQLIAPDFLGRSRPSLIEAARYFSPPRTDSRPFWGVRAPASLKPIPIRASWSWPSRFLGRSRPSLIEAACGWRGRRRPSSFLGRSRPSLIEASPSRRMPQKPAAFWGVRAPASLKPVGFLLRVAAAAAFLGRSRPSLIEACRSAPRRALGRRPFWGVRAPASLKPRAHEVSRAIRRRLSGAFAPQPH